MFESHPSLQTNQDALSEYVKALVKVDRLDDSELLKTLQRGELFTGTEAGLYFIKLISQSGLGGLKLASFFG